jgi:hypothetical protein
MNSTVSFFLSGSQFGQICDGLRVEWGDEKEVEPSRFSHPESHAAVKRAVNGAINPRKATDGDIKTLQASVRDHIYSITAPGVSDLRRRAAVRFGAMPSGPVFDRPVSDRIASLNLNTDSGETVARQVLLALTRGEKGETVGDVLKALRDKMQEEAAGRFSKTGEIGRKVAQALWDVYSFNRDEREDFIRSHIRENSARNIFFLTEYLFFADAGWQEMPAPDKTIHLVSHPSFDFRARQALTRSYPSDLFDYTDMMTAVHHELLAMALRNRLICYNDVGYWMSPQRLSKADQNLAALEALSQLKSALKKAAESYLLAGNLPAARRCLYFIIEQKDPPAALYFEILSLFTEEELAACEGEFAESLVLSPRSVLYRLADANSQSGDDDKAAAVLGRWSTGKPKEPGRYLLRQALAVYLAEN